MYIDFKMIDSVLCPVISDINKGRDYLAYDVNNKNSKEMITSLLIKYKNLFILCGSVDRDCLVISNDHYEKKKGYLYVNKSYLSFWSKRLSRLDNFTVDSLIASI